MRALLPHGLEDLTTDDAIYAAYATPRRDWVRANFVSSADGSATLDGTAGELGSPADQQVLAILRAHADVVVVGAGTVRAEGYGPLKHTSARTLLRERAGFTQTARLAVVTRHPDFSGTERWIAEAPVPPLVLVPDHTVCTIPGAEVVGCGSEWVDAATAIDALAARGLTAVLCEGGPHLFGDFASSGRLDELCLTISPVLVGPGTPRIVAGPDWVHARRGSLSQLLEDDGLLFARYHFA